VLLRIAIAQESHNIYVCFAELQSERLDSSLVERAAIRSPLGGKMRTLSDWEKVSPKPLGSGGQSTVYLVRTPQRKAMLEKSYETIGILSGQGLYQHTGTALAFAKATLDIAREDLASELGALKEFRPRAGGPEAEQQAVSRMRNEIAVLEQKRPGLLKLLDSNESESWIVTEYCPGGTLEGHLPKYKGNVKLALASLLPLVKTVAELHKESIVHRDIKPQNIFVGNSGELLLGDFGIVFLPNQNERLSATGESVGPRDFMPPWVFLDELPGKINPSFDVYMLGKVLWCMVAGKLKLHREDFLDDRFNVVKLFPHDPNMHIVNQILEHCVVPREKDCLTSAIDLLLIVATFSEMLQHDGQIVREGVPRFCKVCGIGHYQTAASGGTFSLSLNQFVNGVDNHMSVFRMTPFICDRCGNIQVFRALA
jgi:serine/threonine protein kinase